MGSVSAAIVDCLREHARKLQRCLVRAVSSGGIEPVHNLRVASRRLAEPLRLLRDEPGFRSTSGIRKELRRLRRAFQRVRDLDVMIERLTAPGPAGGTVIAGVLRAMRTDRAREMKAAVRLSAKPGRRAIKGLGRLVSALQRQPPAEEDLRGRLRRLLERREAALQPALRRDRAGGGDPHELRIAVKRLRYVLEPAAAAGLSGSTGLPRLRRMQETLGDWHDRFVLAEELARRSESPRVVRRPGAPAALLSAAAVWMRSAERALRKLRFKPRVQEARKPDEPDIRGAAERQDDSRTGERNGERPSRTGRERITGDRVGGRTAG
jgi:CHAD domain-containing protein